MEKYHFWVSKENPFSWEKFLEDWEQDGGDYRIVVSPEKHFLIVSKELTHIAYQLSDYYPGDQGALTWRFGHLAKTVACSPNTRQIVECRDLEKAKEKLEEIYRAAGRRHKIVVHVPRGKQLLEKNQEHQRVLVSKKLFETVMTAVGLRFGYRRTQSGQMVGYNATGQEIDE